MKQWLFTCDTCAKYVCCFCAKECHAAGHTLSDVKYTLARCGRVEIIERHQQIVARVCGVDGSWVNKTEIV
jgi:hypothetical protein